MLILCTELINQKYSYKALPLPPNHFFKLIELMSEITKNYYKRHMKQNSKTMKKCESMWREALQTVRPVI